MDFKIDFSRINGFLSSIQDPREKKEKKEKKEIKRNKKRNKNRKQRKRRIDATFGARECRPLASFPG